VDESVLLWLYRNCRALLYPSSFEGFGLPVVEAMSQGAAVLTSRGSSLVEVAGEAAMLVDPTREGEMAAALGALATDDALRRRLGGLGREHSRRFSWSPQPRPRCAPTSRRCACRSSTDLDPGPAADPKRPPDATLFAASSAGATGDHA
jgi:hypothetical protein